MAPHPIDRRRRVRAPILLAATLGSLACPAAPDVSSQGADASAEEAAPAPPPEVPYDGRIHLFRTAAEAGDTRTPLDPEAGLALPEGATLFLETWQRLEDHRVRLTTPADRLVPFTLESGPVAAREIDGHVVPGGTWIRLSPARPLRPGAEYQVRIEPELGERITDAEGRDYEDLVLSLRLAEPEAEAISDDPPTDEADR